MGEEKDYWVGGWPEANPIVWRIAPKLKIKNFSRFARLTGLQSGNMFGVFLEVKMMASFTNYWQVYYGRGNSACPRFYIRTDRAGDVYEFQVDKVTEYDEEFVSHISTLLRITRSRVFTDEQKEYCMNILRTEFVCNIDEIKEAIELGKIISPDPGNIENCISYIEKNGIFEKVITCPNCFSKKFIEVVDDWQRRTYKWYPYNQRCTWCGILFLKSNAQHDKSIHKQKSYAKPFCGSCNSNTQMKRFSKDSFYSWICSRCKQHTFLKVFEFQKRKTNKSNRKNLNNDDDYDDESDSHSASDYYENDSVREAYEEMYDELDGIRNEYASDNDSGWYE